MAIYTDGFQGKLVKAKRIAVEDHDNGFMIIGTNLPDEARKVLTDYVDDVESYAFATPTHYAGRSACWLTDHPGHHWEGSEWMPGHPMPRVNYTK
jgi:hypothetical protein